MRDTDCVDFLRWALPRLGMRWRGFRRVRRQVCRRLGRRLKELELEDLTQYRSLLASGRADAEWARLDSLCRISISRFLRDQGVFWHLEHNLLPRLLGQAQERRRLRIWSIGCASGEEPYTLALMRAFTQSSQGCEFEIVASDTDPHLLARARRGCYPSSSLRELPMSWRAAFKAQDDEFCLEPNHRAPVRFVEQDIRQRSVDGPFDLILCRNLVFTYFAAALQAEIAQRLAQALILGGFLILGSHESLPEALPTLEAERPWLYRRRSQLPQG